MGDEGGKRRTLLWVLVGVVALACVAAAAGGALFVLGSPAVAKAVERAEASYCMQRLRAIYQETIQVRIQSGGIMDVRAAIERAGDSPSAYALRDLEAFPLQDLDGAEPLVACPGGAREKHPPELHVLYADGSVRTLTLAGLKAEGIVPPDADAVFTGPGSPVPDLRKLQGR